ncbi:YdeI/OmpD-associated family protein [Croceitalea rosinachiae]|uniref:YdeI/OmpD-associated family protein n=1 Tax=Croceitalea rosinachiae TaxID=3075596 RepID=A0ABU3AEJ5_9FLAO|nr:DUF1801 domain-containing protein [Croceitalea sp. F388]MDT0608225.1 YdeI/OmpD-associated family protein [Croceitalea sp. F388]
MDKSEKLEKYFNEEHHYRGAIGLLRELALSTNVEETYKWQFPTYTVAGKNVFAICKFKNHFGIWFFNGTFLKDPKKVLQNAQEGKTMAMRHWKFESIKEIDKKIVLGYIKEAITNQKQGKVLAAVKKKPKAAEIPSLLLEALKKNKALEASFKNLTIYKQNEYCEYIQTAKQEKTKLSRLEKSIPLIEQGKGLNDKYR